MVPVWDAVREHVSRALKQIVAEEKTPERMLDAPAHLHQIPEDVPPRVLVGLDVDQAHGDEEIHPGHDVPGVLDQLVEVGHLPSLFKLIQEIRLQMAQLVADAHVQLVVTLRREQGRAEFTWMGVGQFKFNFNFNFNFKGTVQTHPACWRRA